MQTITFSKTFGHFLRCVPAASSVPLQGEDSAAFSDGGSEYGKRRPTAMVDLLSSLA